MAGYRTDGDFRTDAAVIGYRGSLIKLAASRTRVASPFEVLVAYATAAAEAAEHFAYSPDDPASYWPALARASALQARLDEMRLIPALLEGPIKLLHVHATNTLHMIRNGADGFGRRLIQTSGYLLDVTDDEHLKIEAFWRFFDVVGKRAQRMVKQNPEIAEAFSALWFAGAKTEAIKYARESAKMRLTRTKS